MRVYQRNIGRPWIVHPISTTSCRTPAAVNEVVAKDQERVVPLGGAGGCGESDVDGRSTMRPIPEAR